MFLRNRGGKVVGGSINVFFFKTTFTFDNKSIDKGLTGDNQRVAEEF